MYIFRSKDGRTYRVNEVDVIKSMYDANSTQAYNNHDGRFMQEALALPWIIDDPDVKDEYLGKGKKRKAEDSSPSSNAKKKTPDYKAGNSFQKRDSPTAYPNVQTKEYFTRPKEFHMNDDTREYNEYFNAGPSQSGKAGPSKKGKSPRASKSSPSSKSKSSPSSKSKSSPSSKSKADPSSKKKTSPSSKSKADPSSKKKSSPSKKSKAGPSRPSDPERKYATPRASRSNETAPTSSIECPDPKKTQMYNRDYLKACLDFYNSNSTQDYKSYVSDLAEQYRILSNDPDKTVRAVATKRYNDLLNDQLRKNKARVQSHPDKINAGHPLEKYKSCTQFTTACFQFPHSGLRDL